MTKDDLAPNEDPRFTLVREALNSYAADASDPPVPQPSTEGGRARVHAAVALILRGGSSPLDVLLIKRAAAQGDPWSGHMALPGGRWDETDTSLLETAVRETREEVGADLDAIAQPLGRLSPLAPTSRLLPPLHIQPFVFGVPGGFEAAPASGEVTAVHWVTLDALRDPDNHSTVEFRFDGNPRTFPCFRVVPGEVVWGLTYRILTELLEVPDRW